MEKWLAKWRIVASGSKENCSPVTLNGAQLAHQNSVKFLGMWEEAEQMLSEAAARAPQQPDLLLGLAVTARHSGKPEVSGRYLAQLLDSHPEHQFTKEYGVKSSEFKRLVAQYQPSVAS
ncbi:hypothetical protein evm_011222 [Chilo suppressalis]|nr:hypothetical protein evm_011222 [Chilo suppressalis]